ncbi:Right handed beta helix region [Prosthecobacter fusiformis]|uniref:Right handed beta helix region n=1 Tax=Prosthecobacter fusiformis TaxID=48464 RepID=A0A4R7RKA5_9BACT|nr:right-handed parallel beta-helix repeat-containing protein [Prosthecobacter fusiformis]TDU64588.1 Right handed beta helix region [Prosthecobacter fusiformis]
MKKAIVLTSLFAFIGSPIGAVGPTESDPILAQPASGFEVRVSAPGPDVSADDVLQAAIDKVSTRGGGVVLLGAGDFKLSRKQGEQTVVIKSNVTLRGQGHATHIYLDPKTPSNPERYYPVRIGTDAVPAHNVVIENLRYTGNDKAIGGGSIMGFNARLDAPESLLLSCDNITVRHCWIYDAKQAVGCTKATAFYMQADRIVAQFKNWQVHHNFIDTCGNKAIELGECNGGLIADNHIINTVDGPQVIFGTRNVQIRDNVVFFTRTGINVSEGSHHIRVSGNHVEPMPGRDHAQMATCLLLRTEPKRLHTRISDVGVTGNIFRNQSTPSKCTVSFLTNIDALSCVYEGLTFTSNVFDGDVQLFDKRMPDKTTIKDIVFADNICEGDLLSESQGKMMSSHVMVRANVLRKAGVCTLNASQWIWTGNTHVNGTLKIAPGAKDNIIRDNVTASPITDQDDGNSLVGNVVMKKTVTP